MNFICNCCGCCCEALLAIKRFAIARTIHSNFIARAGNDCRGCGKCEKVCPVNAIHMEDGPAGKRFAFVDPERCIGCGVCVRSCAFGQLTLEARPERAITPLNTVNRVVAMAAERGMIKELLEDNDAMGNHRIMAAVIGAIMKLPARRGRSPWRSSNPAIWKTSSAKWDDGSERPKRPAGDALRTIARWPFLFPGCTRHREYRASLGRGMAPLPRTARLFRQPRYTLLHSAAFGTSS